jgi:hypothetical protein
MTDNRRTILINQARTLLISRAEVLADFEADLIGEVWSRIRRDAAALAAVTTAEWQVIEDAVSAMLAAPAQAIQGVAA